MTRTHLIAVLIGLAAICILATDASAYYDPGTGRFLSRDPGLDSTMGTPQIATGGPAVGGGFLPRDPINTVNQPNVAVAAYPRVGQITPDVYSGPARIGAGIAAPQPQGRSIKRDPIVNTPYADGMNLYAYVGNSPGKYVDPSGLFRFGDLLPGLVGGDHSVGISNLICARKIGRAYFKELGGGIHHEDPQDSFLHCLVSCEIAKHCGQAAARLAGRVQESGNDWETHRDTQDDEVANSYGRNCAKGKKKKCIDCDDCCEKGFFYPNGRYRY